MFILWNRFPNIGIFHSQKKKKQFFSNEMNIGILHYIILRQNILRKRT